MLAFMDQPGSFGIGSWPTRARQRGRRARWIERNAGLPDEHCVFRIGIDPDSGRLYAGVYRDAVFVSEDFGRTWRKDGLEGSLVYNFIFVPNAAK